MIGLLSLFFCLPIIQAARNPDWYRCECSFIPWEAWSDCTSTCFGTRVRERTVQLTNYDGCDEFTDCATPDEARDYDDCNEVCHNGGVPSGLWWEPCNCQAGFYGDCCDNLVDCGHPGDIVNGNIQVAGTTYRKTVSYTCNQYYNLTDGDSVQTCQDNFAWSGSKPSCVFVNTCASNPCLNLGTCVDGLNMYTCWCEPGWSGVNCENDIQPPTMSECPGDILVNATDRTAFINWTEPGFSDPLGNTIDITTNYPTPGFVFPWGDFTVQYTATKTNNGLSTECIFQVRVRPTPCDELNIPVNGARICNGWKTDYGRVCIMGCQERFTLFPTDSYEHLFVCGASGNWIFPAPMPDCSVPVDSPDDALVYQAEHASYSFTSCADDSSTVSLKQQYIKVLRQSGEFSSFCSKYPVECMVDNVQVSCLSTV